MANIKTTLQTAKNKISTELKKKVIPVVIFVSGLMLVSCGGNGKNKGDLTYKDFSGKALKERTIDELQRAKHNMENGYVIVEEWQYVYDVKVPELGFKSAQQELMWGKPKDLSSYPDYIKLLDLINNEIKSRGDTIITKEEYFKLKNNQR
jgi:hypothetical protein